MDDNARDDRIGTTGSMRPDGSAFKEAVWHEDPKTWGTGAETSAAGRMGTGSEADRDFIMPPMDSRADDEMSGRGHPTMMREDTMPMGDSSAAAPPPATVAPMVMPPPRSATTMDAEPRERDIGTRAEDPVDRPRLSIGATFLGWSVASFFMLLFIGIAGAILGATAAGEAATDTVNNGTLEQLATGGSIAYLVSTFLAFVIGGYAAGRISLWDGVKHGMGTVFWSILFIVLAIVLGATAAAPLVQSSGIALDATTMSGAGILVVVLTLVVMLLGGALGGRMGERYHKDGARAASRRGHVGGRPF